MDGFKNSTKTHYMKGGSCDGYAKGGKVKGAAKISKVMGEFKSGTLHSGSKKGPEVTNPKQAVAIALSEARKAGAKIPVKKKFGGMVESTSSRPTDAKGRPISNDRLNAPEGAAGAVARGNRMQRLEGDEEAKLLLLAKKRPAREMNSDAELAKRAVQRKPVKERNSVAEQSALSARLQRPVSAQDMARAQAAKGKGSFCNLPLIGPALGAARDAVRDLTGYKKGGLAAMPGKKK